MDLDDEELEATRRLNGVAKESNIEEDIKRCEKLIEPQNANWIGITNQLAIAHLIEKVKELRAMCEEYCPKAEIYKKKNTELITGTDLFCILCNQLLILYKEQDNYNARIEKKSAEIEKYKSLYNKALGDLVKADRENIQLKKQIDLMVKAMNKIQDPQICKYCDNNINLNNGYCTDAKKCKEGVKKYFERKVENEN